ncbi:MAG: hypothetical protein ACK56F_33275, partial [bacterium]
HHHRLWKRCACWRQFVYRSNGNAGCRNSSIGQLDFANWRHHRPDARQQPERHLRGRPHRQRRQRRRGRGAECGDRGQSLRDELRRFVSVRAITRRRVVVYY